LAWRCALLRRRFVAMTFAGTFLRNYKNQTVNRWYNFFKLSHWHGLRLIIIFTQNRLLHV